jgi:mannose-1-phosphate guanylyltransferase
VSSDLTEARSGVWAPVQEASVTRPAAQRSPHRWAVLHAGGDGTRLQGLTLKIAGDSRPKQFCSIIGGDSLLAQTRARVEPLFHVDRELFVVTRVHEIYYREELRDVEDSRIISQPLNRGTGVAVAVALLHILQKDPEAVVIFVPCGHYYSDVEACCFAVRSAISGAEQYPDSVILVGAKAHYPEVDYGWIEVGSTISHTPTPLMQVERFWEKPSLPQAKALLQSGCLWNTFLTVGHVRTFLDLVCSQVPDVVASLSKALSKNKLEVAYPLMPTVDLSRQVWTPQPHRLLAIPDSTSGWTDLGSPTRVMDILTRDKLQPAWLRDEQVFSMIGDRRKEH